MLSWEDNVKKVIPYTPGEQPIQEGVIKLNTNENPYPPSPLVRQVLEKFDYSKLRKYPEPNVLELRTAIANYHCVSKDNVFVGVGSDDVLAMAFLTFFNSKYPIMFPDITYSFYDVWAELFGIPYKKIPLNEDFSMNMAEYAKKNGGIVIANPNAPTGLCEDYDAISRTAYLNPGSVVIIDEAYADFSGISLLSLYSKYDNILIVRTFSKSRSLAGSRIGYAIGSKKLIGHLLSVRNSFNSYTMDSLTMEIGIASIKDNEYFNDNINKIIETREWFKAEVNKLGFTYPDSKGNFLFVTHNNIAAKKIFEELRGKNIYTRYFSSSRIKNYLRISIGTREEMEETLKALSEIVSWNH